MNRLTCKECQQYYEYPSIIYMDPDINVKNSHQFGISHILQGIPVDRECKMTLDKDQLLPGFIKHVNTPEDIQKVTSQQAKET